MDAKLAIFILQMTITQRTVFYRRWKIFLRTFPHIQSDRDVNLLKSFSKKRDYLLPPIVSLGNSRATKSLHL